MLRESIELVLERHEALRTNYFIGSDGNPVQSVKDPQEASVATVDLDGVPLDEIDETLRAAGGEFNVLGGDDPLRVIIGLMCEKPCRALLHVHFMAIDGTGGIILEGEILETILARLAGREPELKPADWHPINQADIERSPDMKEQNARAMIYWKEFLSVAPHSTIPFYWGVAPDFCRSLTTEVASKKLFSNCVDASNKHRVSSSTILMAALAVILGNWTGNDRLVVGAVSSNRYSPPSRKLRSSVGRYSRNPKVLMDLSGDPTLAELVFRVFKSSMSAFRNSVCNMGELSMLEARESRKRGARTAISVEFNFHGYLPDGGGRRKLREGIFHQVEGESPLPFPLIDVRPDVGAFLMALRCPESLLSADDARDFLDQLMQVTGLIAREGGMRLSEVCHGEGITRYWTGQNWILFRGSWVNLDDVSSLAARHPDVAAARAFWLPQEERGSQSGGLAIRIAGRNSGIDLAALHEHMRHLASGYPTAAVPQKYILCRDVSLELNFQEPRQNEYIDADSFLVRPNMRPRSRKERAIADAFIDLHSKREANMKASYADLDGDFLKIPAMIESIKRSGYVGLYPSDFLGMASLRHLALLLMPSDSSIASGSDGFVVM